MKLKLTQTQKDVLYVLVTLYRARDHVGAKEIAEVTNKGTGSVRAIMQSLRSLGLVVGTPGPKGGYRPTAKAYELLKITKPEKAVKVKVSVIVNGELVEDLSVEEIDLPYISRPEICLARIRILGDTERINEGDRVVVGPISVNETVLYGKVVGRNDTENTIVVNVERIVALPKDTVGKYISQIVAVDAEIPVREAARILAENRMYCTLVKSNDRFAGIFTLDYLAKAVVEGRLDAKVKEVMRPKMVFVDKDASLREALKLMKEENVRILVVTDKDEPVGVITDQKILAKLAPE